MDFHTKADQRAVGEGPLTFERYGHSGESVLFYLGCPAFVPDYLVLERTEPQHRLGCEAARKRDCDEKYNHDSPTTEHGVGNSNPRASFDAAFSS